MADDLDPSVLLTGETPTTEPAPLSADNSVASLLDGGVSQPTPGNAAGPAAPSTGQVKADYFNSIGMDRPLGKTLFSDSINAVIADPSLNDTRIATDIYRDLHTHGVISAASMNQPLDPMFIEEMRNRGAVTVGRWLSATQIDKNAQGESSFKDKRILHRQAMAYEALAGAPIDSVEAARLLRGVLVSMADQRINEGRTELQGLGQTEDRHGQVALWTEYRTHLARMTDQDAINLYQNMLYEVNRRPVNSLEAGLLAAGSTDALGVMGLRMSSAPPAGFEGHPNDHQYYAIATNLFGANASNNILQEFSNNKVKWVRSKLGYLDTADGGIVTGKRIDHQNFLEIAPTGAAQRLIATAKLQEAPMRRSLVEVEQNEGRAAAQAYLRTQVETDLARGKVALADVANQPEFEWPVTEAAVRSRPGFMQAVIAAFDGLETLFRGGQSVARRVDEVVSSSNFVRRHLIQSSVNLLGSGPYAAERTRSLSEAINNVMMTDITMVRKNFDELNARAAELGLKKWQSAEGAQPGTAAAMEFVRKEETAVDWVHKAYPNAYRMVDRNNTIIGNYLAGQAPKTWQSFGDYFMATLQNTGVGIFAGTQEMLAQVVDDPHAAGGLIAQGMALNPIQRIVTGTASDLVSRMSYSWRLNHDLTNIVAYHPEQMARFKARALDAMDAAYKDILSPRTDVEKVTAAKAKSLKVLNDLVAHLETFEKARRTNGVLPDSGETTRVLARAWPELKDGLGDLGHTLGTNMINRGFLTELAGNVGRVFSTFGRAKPDPAIESLLGSLRTSDLAINILQDLTGARGIALDLARAKERFILENNREPSLDELREIAPQPIQDLYGLMVAAEKANYKAPRMAKVWDFVFRKNKVAQTAPARARDIMNDYISGAMTLVERDRAFGLVRDRVTLLLDHAMNRAGLDIAAKELELDILLHARNQLPPEHAPARQWIRDRARQIITDIRKHQTNTERLTAEMDALWRHDPSKAYKLHPEIEAMLFAQDGYVPGSSLSLMMDMHPAMFDGMTGDILFRTRRRDLTVAERRPWEHFRDQFAEAVNETRRRWRDAEANPATVDREMQARLDERDRLLKEIDLARRTPSLAGDSLKGTPVPESQNAPLQRLLRQYEDIVRAITDRKNRLESGMVASPEVIALEADYVDAVAAAAKHAGRYERAVENGVILDRLFNPEGHARVRELFAHDGLGATEAVLRRMGEKLRQAKSLSALSIGSNPFVFETAPAWYVGEVLHQQLRASGWNMASDLVRAEGMANATLKLSPKQREVIMEAYLKDDPSIIEQSTLPRNEKDNITALFQTETGTYRQVWQMLDDMGKIPKAVVEAWKKNQYDPRLSGLAVRAFAAKGAEGRAVLGNANNLPANPELGALGLDWAEFSFRREPGKWRLRIQQNDVIVDKLFDTEAQVKDYLDMRYGKDAFRDLRAWESDGTRRGRTFHGEPITIGKPMTAAELEIYDHAAGFTPEARQIRLKQVLRDAHLHVFQEGMNSYGDLVMSKELFESHQFHLDTGLRRSYAKIPDSDAARQAFGTLAGKYVHRSVLREMGEAARVYDHLGSLTEGWRRVLEDTAEQGRASAADILGLRTNRLVRGYRNVMSAIKDNMIIKSIRTWVANMTFWAVSDYIAGSNVISIEGLPILWKNLGMFFDEGLGTATDSMMARARRQGLVGGLFENHTVAYTDLARKVFGYENKAQVEALLARRQALYDRLHEAKMTAGTDGAYLTKLERELVSLRLIYEKMTQSILKTGVQKIAGAFIQGNDIVGAPKNRTWSNVRGFYNWLDTAFKTTQFEMLIRKGMDDVTAGNVVRMFTQDYANLPSAIRNNSPLFGSLVPAFPYEATRIAANTLAMRPAKFFGVMTALPMLNLFSFSAAGIDWDKAVKMIAARGKSDPIMAALSMMNTIYLADPTTGELRDEINVGGWLPFASLGQASGFLTRTYDRVLPPEKRSLPAQIAGLGVRYMSNYFLSNPGFNALGGWLQNIDTMTGEPLWGKADSTWHVIRTLGRQFANQVFPPMLYGRDWEAWERSRDAHPSPKTQRLFKADQEATVYLRAFTGVTWRGKTIQQIVDEIGFGTRPAHPLVDENDLVMSQSYKSMSQFGGFFGLEKIPSYGEYNELRELAYGAMDSAISEDERKAHAKAAEELYRQQTNGDVEALAGLSTRSEREFAHWMKGTQEGDVLATFKAMNLLAQTHALTELESAGISDNKVKDMVSAMQMTDLLAIKAAPDEEMIQKAIGLIDYRIQHAGMRGVNPRLYEIRRWIDGIMRAKTAVKVINEGINELRNDALKQALGGAQ